MLFDGLGEGELYLYAASLVLNARCAPELGPSSLTSSFIRAEVRNKGCLALKRTSLRAPLAVAEIHGNAILMAAAYSNRTLLAHNKP